MEKESIKHENIYLTPENGGIKLYEGVKKYIEFYNSERRYTSINNNSSEKYLHPFITITKKKPRFELFLS